MPTFGLTDCVALEVPFEPLQKWQDPADFWPKRLSTFVRFCAPISAVELIFAFAQKRTPEQLDEWYLFARRVRMQHSASEGAGLDLLRQCGLFGSKVEVVSLQPNALVQVDCEIRRVWNENSASLSLLSLG
jgi:hypothetical protein